MRRDARNRAKQGELRVRPPHHERAQHDASHSGHVRRALRRNAVEEGIDQRHHRTDGKEPQDVLLPFREQGFPHHVDLPLRSGPRAQEALSGERLGVRGPRQRLRFAVPLLHPAEVGRPLARPFGVLRMLRLRAGGEAQVLHPGPHGQQPVLAAQLPVQPVPAGAAARPNDFRTQR